MIFHSFDVKVDFEEDSSFNVDLGYTPPQNEYEGVYQVTPSDREQQLPTANKLLTANVVINPIPSNYGLITYNGSTITVS